MILITHAHLYTPTVKLYPAWMLVEDSQIHSYGEGTPPQPPPGGDTQVIDARGGHLLPGFIDIHVHGAMGHELMDASPEGLRLMARFYAQHGVTSFLPSTWAAPHEQTWRALEMASGMIGPVENGATILGVHMEGPYLNAAKCGAQEPAAIRRADPYEARAYLDTGIVRYLSLAPEFPENHWLIEECVRRGIAIALGHTEATYDQVKEAVIRGVRSVTHTFNAMVGLSHRQPGTVGAALTIPELSCELIADNIHIHPAVMKLLVNAKTPAGVILITDAMRGAGLPDGDYQIDQRTVTVRDGAVRLPDGTLAGSTLTIDRALRNILTATGRPLEEIWPMTSQNAARLLGLGTKGSLEPGKDADLVILDNELKVATTIVGGKVVSA
jgi:N-acetylglucosamine-6-phosphate deacetylase